MTPELIGILTVGLVLAGLVIGLFAWLRTDIRDLALRMGNMEERMANVEKEVAFIHGILSPRPVLDTNE